MGSSPKQATTHFIIKIMRNTLYLFTIILLACPANSVGIFTPGAILSDDRGIHVNAHGGGILYYEGKYYWFGEHKGEKSNAAWVGVTCYSSDDLYNWKYESLALPVVKDDPKSDIVEGCILERPKVIYNKKTKQFVMFFHLELKGIG
ncbi:hypothetical protein EZS27_027948 [termite gut metagenome]|uniref:Beta-glucanase n=1 Tax=termite gut metagenome TaxID=433724 RepID=A0A5J4QMY9_9ZZZZ